MTDRNDDNASQIHKDAAGQFGKSQAKRDASGVVSAKPTVITGSEDATAHKMPPGQKAKPEWSTHFNESETPHHTD
jgi:hypothetical protein